MTDAVTRARKLLDKATPGPWCATYDRTGVMGSPQESITTVIPTVVEFALSEHDAELIAAAPTLLAKLADEVERLRALTTVDEALFLRCLAAAQTTDLAQAAGWLHDSTDHSDLCPDCRKDRS